MALVLFANTKGGSGKTTAALVLAGELAKHKAKVVLLEGDPNRPIMNWATARGMTVLETSKLRISSAADAAKMIEGAAVLDSDGGRLAVVHDDDQDGVFDWIEGAASWAHFVIADPEGSPKGPDRLADSVLAAGQTIDLPSPTGGSCTYRITATFRDGREASTTADLCGGGGVALK